MTSLLDFMGDGGEDSGSEVMVGFIGGIAIGGGAVLNGDALPSVGSSCCRDNRIAGLNSFHLEISLTKRALQVP